MITDEEKNELLPKRLVNYIHNIGVRALDHLADNFAEPATAPEGAEAVPPSALQSLIGQ